MIRKADKSDIEPLQIIARRTVSENYRGFLGDTMVDQYLESGATDQYVIDNIGKCYVILSEDCLMGFSVTKDNLIDLMMIDYVFHRRGFGSLLLQYCENKLFKNYDQIRLESFEPNLKANNFYIKNGWKQDKIYDDDESGVKKILFIKSATDLA